MLFVIRNQCFMLGLQLAVTLAGATGCSCDAGGDSMPLLSAWTGN